MSSHGWLYLTAADSPQFLEGPVGVFTLLALPHCGRQPPSSMIPLLQVGVLLSHVILQGICDDINIWKLVGPLHEL